MLAPKPPEDGLGLGSVAVRTAAVRGRDGRVREYASRPYAADYVKNPLGDLLVNMPDFKVTRVAVREYFAGSY
eukprot:397438-Prorocentrum_minimum.AAC.1